MNSSESHLTIETDGERQNYVYTSDRKQHNFDKFVFLSITDPTKYVNLVRTQ